MLASGKLNPATGAEHLLSCNRDQQQGDEGENVSPVNVFEQRLVVHDANEEHQAKAADHPINLFSVKANKLRVQSSAVYLEDPEHAQNQHEAQEHPVKVAE